VFSLCESNLPLTTCAAGLASKRVHFLQIHDRQSGGLPLSLFPSCIDLANIVLVRLLSHFVSVDLYPCAHDSILLWTLGGQLVISMIFDAAWSQDIKVARPERVRTCGHSSFIVARWPWLFSVYVWIESTELRK